MEGFDSLVKDMSLAEWGRKEIELAQVEMPGKYSQSNQDSMDPTLRLIEKTEVLICCSILYRLDGLPC